MKTSDLIGPALDWAVAKCEGREDPIYRFAPTPADKDFDPTADYSRDFYISGPEKCGPYSPSTKWAQGGPIIEREGIAIRQVRDKTWRADYSQAVLKSDGNAYAYLERRGPTPLIASMRCYCASKLGDEVEIPEELK